MRSGGEDGTTGRIGEGFKQRAISGARGTDRFGAVGRVRENGREQLQAELEFARRALQRENETVRFGPEVQADDVAVQNGADLGVCMLAKAAGEKAVVGQQFEAGFIGRMRQPTVAHAQTDQHGVALEVGLFEIVAHAVGELPLPEIEIGDVFLVLQRARWAEVSVGELHCAAILGRNHFDAPAVIVGLHDPLLGRVRRGVGDDEQLRRLGAPSLPESGDAIVESGRFQPRQHNTGDLLRTAKHPVVGEGHGEAGGDVV